MSAAPADEFHRIRRLPPYVFAEVNAKKGAARGVGEDVIDRSVRRGRDRW